jgi:methylthioribose-1-phosphate isomerase
MKLFRLISISVLLLLGTACNKGKLVGEYYSTELGIVKIDFLDGTTWELESIEW